MAKITQSLALTSLFPETVNSVDRLEEVVRWLSRYRFSMMEYYTVPGQDERISALFQELGLESVFIAVLPLKAAGYSLCAPGEDERQKAVSVLKSCIDRADRAGAQRIMINSGFLPKDKAMHKRSLENYVRSVVEATQYIEDIGSDLLIELEPGDSKVQSFQLLGPTKYVLQTTQQILERSPRYTLVMDAAHIEEEGEDVMEVFRSVKPYCNHIHFCNCFMENPDHPLFGDKHVDFDFEGACFTYDDFERMFNELRALYQAEDLIITLEITCREEDNFAWFDQIAQRCAWLFS